MIPGVTLTNPAAFGVWLASDAHKFDCAAYSEGQACCLDALAPVPLLASTRFCPYCGARYELPPLTRSCVEFTANVPPPAHVMIWAVPLQRRRPDYDVDPVVHQCRRGVAQ